MMMLRETPEFERKKNSSLDRHEKTFLEKLEDMSVRVHQFQEMFNHKKPRFLRDKNKKKGNNLASLNNDKLSRRKLLLRKFTL